MWTQNKRDRCLRLTLLVINCVACVAVVYFYATYTGNKKISGILPENFIHTEKLTEGNCTPVCDSKACVWHANLFLKTTDSTADPCENYLSFLCGGFREQYGPGENGHVLKETDDLLLTKGKDILENIQAKPGSASAKMKTVYDSCVNYDSSELQGIEELYKFLRTMGILNWPNLAHDFNFNDVGLPKVLGIFIAFGSKKFIELDSTSEDENFFLKVSFEKFVPFDDIVGLPHEQAVSMLKYFDIEEKDIAAIIQDHRLIKNAIKNLHKENPYNMCPNYTCPDEFIHCLRGKEDIWHDFCETVDVILNFTTINEPINNISTIYVGSDRIFFQKLFPLLRTFSKRTFANFIVMSFIKGYQSELNFYFRLQKLKHKDFDHEILMDNYELGRWEFCVRWIAENMPLPLVNELYRHFITSSMAEELISMYNDYSSEIMDLVTLQKWIPAELKSNIISMMNRSDFNIRIHSLFYPNDSYVDKFYEKFSSTRESFFSNVLQLKMLSNIIEDYRVKTFQEMTKVEVYANLDRNVEIHFGMLLPPFHVPGHNRLMNRLLLTPLMAHELGHFVYMEMAEYKNIDKNEIFLEKRQCVWDQFSKFKFENTNEYLNSSNYDSENFPDVIATTIIDKVIEQNYSHILLPGLPYSTKQLLYMSSVQIWCEKSNLRKDLMLKNDVHAPSEIRLQAMMQNSRGFPEAFNCPEGSYMNPATKCAYLDA